MNGAAATAPYHSETMDKKHLNRMQCTIHNVEYNECYSPKTNTATSCPVCMEERFHKAYDRAEAAEKHVELLLSVIELKSTQILCQNAGGMARELAAQDSESPTKQNG